MKKGISFLCVWNNAKLFSDMCASVEPVTLPHEIIGIDNRSGEFSSAAAAYNQAIKAAEYEVLVFAHQDILFNDIQTIDRIYKLACNEPKTLIGVAGVHNTGRGTRIISSIKFVLPSGELRQYRTLQCEQKDVFTIDECLFASNHTFFDAVRFDEAVCDGWHLYAADLCIQANLMGRTVCVVAADVTHRSCGTINNDFYAAEKKLVKKYRGIIKKLTYSCGYQRTSFIGYWATIGFKKIRYGSFQGLKRKVKAFMHRK